MQYRSDYEMLDWSQCGQRPANWRLMCLARVAKWSKMFKIRRLDTEQLLDKPVPFRIFWKEKTIDYNTDNVFEIVYDAK